MLMGMLCGDQDDPYMGLQLLKRQPWLFGEATGNARRTQLGQNQVYFLSGLLACQHCGPFPALVSCVRLIVHVIVRLLRIRHNQHALRRDIDLSGVSSTSGLFGVDRIRSKSNVRVRDGFLSGGKRLGQYSWEASHEGSHQEGGVGGIHYRESFDGKKKLRL